MSLGWREEFERMRGFSITKRVSLSDAQTFSNSLSSVADFLNWQLFSIIKAITTSKIF